MNKFMVVCCIAILGGCASQEPLKKSTQSGKPEGVYQNTSKDNVRDALLSYCNNQGLIVFSSDTSSVICGKEQDGSSGLLTQVLIGNAYSTPPIAKVRFSISQLNESVKVWADMWVETQMAMGQIKQIPLISNEDKNVIQDRLDNLKL